MLQQLLLEQLLQQGLLEQLFRQRLLEHGTTTKQMFVPTIIVETVVPTMIVGTAVPTIIVLTAYYWKSRRTDFNMDFTWIYLLRIILYPAVELCYLITIWSRLMRDFQ